MKNILSILSLSIILFSCSKSDDPTKLKSYTGSWNIGYVSDNEYFTDDPITGQASVKIDKNGKLTIELEDGQNYITDYQLKVRASNNNILEGDGECTGCASYDGTTADIVSPRMVALYFDSNLDLTWIDIMGPFAINGIEYELDFPSSMTFNNDL